MQNLFAHAVSEEVPARDLRHINRLLKSHRSWIKPTTRRRIAQVRTTGEFWVVRSFSPRLIVGCMVLIPKRFLSLQQLEVRDLCAINDERIDQMEVYAALHRVLQQRMRVLKLEQAFLTCSKFEEQQMLSRCGWSTLNTTAFALPLDHGR